MITNIKILGDSQYLLNEAVKITINEDVSVTAEFDESILTENEVNEMIDQFFDGIKETLAQEAASKDMKKRELPPGATTEVFEQDKCVGED